MKLRRHCDELLRGTARSLTVDQNEQESIASICVGALSVAASGVLEGRYATTSHLMGSQRRDQLAAFGAEVVDGPIVRDGHIVTSTGPATAVDVAFGLLEDLTDEANAVAIRHLMGFGSKDVADRPD